MGKDLRRLGAGIGVLLEIDKSGGETLARQKTILVLRGHRSSSSGNNLIFKITL